jgi:Tol biopolymer transport system component/DNA-binding winged helix-turn-helix (wHTH) protein
MKVQNRRIYSFDGFELDAANRQLRRADKPLSLPAKAFDVLVALVENSGRLVSKDEIFSNVWHDQIVEESNLTVHVSQIRKALGENKNDPRYIETVPGYGYRFVGEVSNLEDEELVIETETLSRITIEREEAVSGTENGRQREMEKISALPHIAESPRYRSRTTLFAVIGGFAVLLAVGIAGFAVLLAMAYGAFRSANPEKVNLPFEKIKYTRLTNNGKVSRAAVSPDGKYIAYVLGESEGNSIWVQQVGTASSIALIPPVRAQVWELTFTPDGSHIFYSLFADGKSDLEFYRISSLGGISEKIPNVFDGFIAFAPDGKHFAYAKSDSAAGQNYLVISDADGSNQQRIAAKTHPNTFETNAPVVAWSPDGETIACLVNHFEADASYSSIVAINIKDGSEKPLSGQRWYDVFSIEWMKNGSGLLISASEKVSGSNQIHLLSYPQGEARQITNDLSQYDSLSAASDGESFISIETNTVNGIHIGKAGADANEFEEIISETGALYPFVWTPDGKIIFRSNKDGASNLWMMDSDGGNRRQLTANAQVDSRGLCISPDGKYLVFGSWRNGKSNLWRVDSDGGNLTQLTNGEVDVYPRCSPDNRNIVYQKGLHSQQMLWKVPLSGGEPVQLTESNARWDAISNDGRRISYFFMTDDKWRLGIISFEGGPMLQSLDVPANLKENSTVWSADDRSLLYIGAVGSVGNIWSLPLDGSAAKAVTNFKSDLTDDFSLSPDGKRLAVARGSTQSDVVMITNEPQP